jgi:hypothetical protein
VKACQSGCPPPLEMPLVTIRPVAIPGWHVC